MEDVCKKAELGLKYDFSGTAFTITTRGYDKEFNVATGPFDRESIMCVFLLLS